MKIDTAERLRKFESDLAVIEFVQPSENYVEKGRSLLKERRMPPLRLLWTPSSRSIIAFSGSVVLVIGVLIGFNGFEFYGFNTTNSDARLLEQRMRSSHQLISSLDVSSLQANSNDTLVNHSPLVAVNEFLVVNCQDCHEPRFLTSLLSGSVEDTAADLSRVIKQNIVARIANSGS